MSDNDGYTAVHLAAKEGHGDVLETLLSTGQQAAGLDYTSFKGLAGLYAKFSCLVSLRMLILSMILKSLSLYELLF